MIDVQIVRKKQSRVSLDAQRTKRHKAPADVNARAVMIGESQLAKSKTSHRQRQARSGRKKGGSARAKALSAERRKEIASRAAKVRWKTMAEFGWLLADSLSS